MPTTSPPTRLVGRSPLLRGEGESLAPGSARSLLITILGELVWPTGEPVWTSTLVRLLKGQGIEEQTARQAIARGAQSGWMVPERRGREVSWSLGPDLERIFEVGSKRVFSLSDPFTEWTGDWLSVLITIPSTHRRARRPLYAGLTWAGFGNPVPGLWLSPHVERAGEVQELVRELDLQEHAISFVGRTDVVGIDEREIVARGWDLASLEEHYEMVLKVIGELSPAPGDETMSAFLRMISEWQVLPRTDPQLPEALLPGWIGRRVAREIEERRDAWTPSVRAHFAEMNTNN